MNCPLCHYEFDSSQMSCHASCALNASCAIICCPNCGYQMPDETRSRTANALRNWLSRRRARPIVGSIVPLTALQPGQNGVVVSVQSTAYARLERLHILGLMPEAHIRLEQKTPTHVLQVGFTQITIDSDIAREIQIRVAD